MSEIRASSRRPTQDEVSRSPRSSLVVVFSLFAPLVLAWMLHLAGDAVTSATSVLVLVLVVVASGVFGRRTTGVLAALSAGAWFDFFLTDPRLSFKVLDRDDIEATVLLLVVGVAVTEVTAWGRRQQARASRRAGYLDGLLRAADMATLHDSPPEQLVGQVAEQITAVLDIDECRYEAGDRWRSTSVTTMHRDGSVTQRAAAVDVDRRGLPTDDLIALVVERDGVVYGRFLLAASTHQARPTIEQRRVAAVLADQVAVRLARDRPHPERPDTSATRPATGEGRPEFQV